MTLHYLLFCLAMASCVCKYIIFQCRTAVRLIFSDSFPSPCYKTENGECHKPLTQGICKVGYWLVASDSNILECVERQCGDEEVMIEGECQDIFDESLCAGFGEAIFLNAKGEPSCECKEGCRGEKKGKKRRVL